MEISFFNDSAIYQNHGELTFPHHHSAYLQVRSGTRAAAVPTPSPLSWGYNLVFVLHTKPPVSLVQTKANAMFSSLLTERLERLGDDFRLSPSSYLMIVPPGKFHSQRMAHRGYSHPVRYPRICVSVFHRHEDCSADLETRVWAPWPAFWQCCANLKTLSYHYTHIIFKRLADTSVLSFFSNQPFVSPSSICMFFCALQIDLHYQSIS